MITPDADLELLKDELANIWFTNSGSEKETIGFGHIFCGEPNDKLGGMHFVGRYVEAQEDKWAGAIWNDKSLCNKSDIKPPVYTFGMKYLGKDGEVKVIAFLIIVRTGHRKAESTARRKDSNRGMFFLALFFIANQ
ncbi:EndoU domain-containing protein [Wolbachia endosymbiont (group A) of Oxytorus armatus]|uniref:EndoU domain-containing protein n=1 Tax=Wolbachia endosymbiont (group A) of Oxytorus armatus TaxID=3066211 RepID=UPI0031329AC2